MAEFAIIQDSNGLVVNMIRAVDIGSVTPPVDHSAILATTDAAIGATWDGAIFVPVPRPPDPPVPPLTAAEVLQSFVGGANKRSPLGLTLRALAMEVAAARGISNAQLKTNIEAHITTLLTP